MRNRIEVFNGYYIKAVTLHFTPFKYDRLIIYYDLEPSIIIWREINGFKTTPISAFFDNVNHFTI